MKGDKVKGKKVVLGLKIFPETNDEKFWFNAPSAATFSLRVYVLF